MGTLPFVGAFPEKTAILKSLHLQRSNYAQALDEHDGKTIEQFVCKSDCTVDGGAAIRAVSDQVGSNAQTRH